MQLCRRRHLGRRARAGAGGYADLLEQLLLTAQSHARDLDILRPPGVQRSQGRIRLAAGLLRRPLGGFLSLVGKVEDSQREVSSTNA